MNLTTYDNALKEKLLKVFPNVVNSSEDKALEYSEDDSAEVVLPLISYWRLGNPLSEQSVNTSGSIRRGRTIGNIGESSRLIFNELFLEISYQIDLWSDRKYEVDSILTELLFYFVEEPYLTINDDNTPEPFDVSFRVTDVANIGTDLSSFSDTGPLHRQSITITLDRAIINHPREKKIVNKIPLRVTIVKEVEVD